MPEQDHQWIFFAEVDHLLDGTELMAETPVRPFQQGDWITITTRKDLLALSVNQLDKEGTSSGQRSWSKGCTSNQRCITKKRGGLTIPLACCGQRSILHREVRHLERGHRHKGPALGLAGEFLHGLFEPTRSETISATNRSFEISRTATSICARASSNVIRQAPIRQPGGCCPARRRQLYLRRRGGANLPAIRWFSHRAAHEVSMC